MAGRVKSLLIGGSQFSRYSPYFIRLLKISTNPTAERPVDVGTGTSVHFTLPAIEVSHHARPTHINSDVGSARHRNREGFCRDQSHVPKYITEGRDRIRYITDLTEKNNFVILPRKGLACSRLRLLPSAESQSCFFRSSQ